VLANVVLAACVAAIINDLREAAVAETLTLRGGAIMPLAQRHP
jgi:hypothetical protein